jgi:hypothetical protein
MEGELQPYSDSATTLPDANPFHELYLQERLTAEQFVELFSPELVKKSEEIFHRGNAVVLGTDGSGKSMILALFDAKIRAAYYRIDPQMYPVPEGSRRFVSAGFSFLGDGVMGVLSKANITETDDAFGVKVLYDFINSFIIRDLIDGLKFYANEPSFSAYRAFGVTLDKDTEERLVHAFNADLTLSNIFGSISSITNLHKYLTKRIEEYHLFAVSTSISLEDLRSKNRTEQLFEIVERFVQVLVVSGVLDIDTSIFIRLDQYETLRHLKDKKLGQLLMSEVQTAISSRSSLLNFRIGCRTYAWDVEATATDQDISAEVLRDYVKLNIDQRFRNGAKDVGQKANFRNLVADLFERRFDRLGYRPLSPAQLFGSAISKREKIRTYIDFKKTQSKSRTDFRKLLFERPTGLFKSLPTKEKDFLMSLVDADPLSAKLAWSWLNQKDPEKRRLFSKAVERGIQESKNAYPWEQREWWVKERINQAEIQICGALKVPQSFFGYDDIIKLSGYNTLNFIRICRQIISTELARTNGRFTHLDSGAVSTIPRNVQTSGIHQACYDFYRDLSYRAGNAVVRREAMRAFGEYLSMRVYEDSNQSNPGHYGFSLSEKDLEKNPELYRFLANLSDFGLVHIDDHTTKNAAREIRRKFYVAPILCPVFRIPSTKTKEPIYLVAEDVLKILRKGNVTVPMLGRAKRSESTLFDRLTNELSQSDGSTG